MKKFVFEFWFRRGFFDKEFDQITIIAKTRKQAYKTFENTVSGVYKKYIISETPYKISKIVTN